MLINMTDENNSKEEDFNLIVRIFGTDIKGRQKTSIGLCKIRGVDKVFSNAVLTVAGIPKDKLVGKLTESDIKKIEEVIKTPAKFNIPNYLLNRRHDPEKGEDFHMVGADLKLQNDFDIRRMKRIRSYKGLRHSWNLKVRGQRLKSYRKGEAAIARKKTVIKK